MGRLAGRAIGARIGTTRSRLRSAPATEAERDRQRNRENKARGWYNTARWARLREKILQRDEFTCQKTGVLLVGRHPAPNSPVIDHKLPHRGDAVLFWDEGNLQAVSKAWHDSEKQRQERRGGL